MENIKIGAKVFLKNTRQEGVIQNIRPQKKEVEVLCGNIRLHSKFSDLAIVIGGQKAQTVKNKQRKESVQIQKTLAPKPVPTIIAVGVARPIAQGQAITSTDVKIFKENAKFSPSDNHIMPDIRAMHITIGTKTPATLSAVLEIGAFLP